MTGSISSIFRNQKQVDDVLRLVASIAQIPRESLAMSALCVSFQLLVSLFNSEAAARGLIFGELTGELVNDSGNQLHKHCVCLRLYSLDTFATSKIIQFSSMALVSTIYFLMFCIFYA